MEIKEQIEKIIAAVSKNPGLKEKLTSDPAGLLQEVLGSKVPPEAASQIVSGVKAKLSADQLVDAAGAIGKMFGK